MIEYITPFITTVGWVVTIVVVAVFAYAFANDLFWAVKRRYK